MSFMKPQRFGDLVPTDIGLIDKGPFQGVWMKIDGQVQGDVVVGYNYNAIKQCDGTELATIGDAQLVKVLRKRVHALDLRQGDICCMEGLIGVGYMTNTVLNVRDKGGYRYIKFIRPRIQAGGFGTTCPSGSVYTEIYEAQVRLGGDYNQNDYFYLVGVDTSAVYDKYSLVLDDRYRLAIFLQKMGDERSLAQILCMDGLKIKSECLRMLWDNYINVREIPPDFPTRDDGAETKYVRELREKSVLTDWERKYLRNVTAIL